jgi:cerevisin
MIGKSIAIFIGVFVLSCSLSAAVRIPHHHVIKTQPHRAYDTAPLLSASNAEVIPNSYIVVLKKDAELDSHLLWFNTLLTGQFTRGDQLNVLKHVYSISDGLMKGYSGIFDENIIDEIRSSPDVAFVERDQIVKALDVEHNATWGLARISHKNLSSLAVPNFDYLYDHSAGENVTAYIVDTGVNIKHEEFRNIDNEGKGKGTSRAVWGMTIPDHELDVDGSGHGTHVAGTVGGLKYGVAKKVKIVAVKVFTNGMFVV